VRGWSNSTARTTPRGSPSPTRSCRRSRSCLRSIARCASRLGRGEAGLRANAWPPLHDATLGPRGGGDGQEDTMDTSWHVPHRPRRQTGRP
jgi:hypothetical protein